MNLPIHHNKLTAPTCPLCDAGLKAKKIQGKNPKIISYWKCEKGKWDKESNTFINRYWSETKEKLIFIEYEPQREIIYFIGGPTGFENFYFKDLYNGLKHDKNENVYICAGTINKWYTCWVKKENLIPILEEIKVKFNINL